MPLAPSNPSSAPQVISENVAMAAVAAASDATVQALVVPRTGYLSAARFVPLSTLTGANTDTRTHTVVSPNTRAITDGIVVVAGTSATKGPWASGSYSTGDIVTYNNGTFVAIASATTEAPTDTTKWQSVNSVGLGYLTSRTAAFTQDDVGKTISGTGYTSAVIVAVLDAQTAQVTANSAIRNALSVTIGASRTLATRAYTSGVSAAANTPTALTLSSTDTKVYKGDILQVVSTHSGSTGLADPGGEMQLDIAFYGEGTD